MNKADLQVRPTGVGPTEPIVGQLIHRMRQKLLVAGLGVFVKINKAINQDIISFTRRPIRRGKVQRTWRG